MIAGVTESISPGLLKTMPKRFTLPFAPAPSSKVLEDAYYLDSNKIASEIIEIIG